MQDLWALLNEALKSGYGKSVLFIALAWITKPGWLEVTRAFREWVRSMPARRRVAFEGKAVDQALNAPTKEQGDRACEVLRLLRAVAEPELPESPVTDSSEAADTSTGDPPPGEASTDESPEGGQTGTS